MVHAWPEIIHAKDEKGESLLHVASSIGFLGGVKFLLEKFRDSTLVSNHEGLDAIHVACANGHVEVVKELLNLWPDKREFRTDNGQNILHVAAERGQVNVVEYILENLSLAQLQNEKDRDGNTPLHLAAKQGHAMIVYALVRDRLAQNEIVNKEGLTSFGVARNETYKIVGLRLKEVEHSQIPISNGKDKQVESNHANDGQKQSAGAELTIFLRMMMTLSILYFFAAQKKLKYPSFQITYLPREEIKSRKDTLLVIAILVAGVTFAGAITMPGSGSGSNTNSSNMLNQNSQEPARDSILMPFYISLNMLAMNAAIMSAIILCWPHLYDAVLASHAVWVASILCGAAIYLMCLAFSFAVAIAVSKYFWFFIVIIAVEGLLFIVQTLLFLPFIVPATTEKIIEKFPIPHFYFMIFMCNVAFKKSIGKLGGRNKKE